MNKLILFTALCFSTLVFTNCDKNDNPPPSNTDYITKSSWKFSSAKAGGIDVTAQVPACFKDNTMLFVANGIGHWRLSPDGVLTPTSSGTKDIGSPTLQVREIYTNTIQPRAIDWVSYTLASWGLASASPTTTFRCSDCNPGTAPCTAGGTGAIASSLNNIWRCP